MTAHRLSQAALENASGVSQSQISNILRAATGCSIENADALAAVFGLQGWHLLIPSLPDDLINSPSISSLVETYVHADPEGRDTIERVVSREKSRVPGPKRP